MIDEDTRKTNKTNNSSLLTVNPYVEHPHVRVITWTMQKFQQQFAVNSANNPQMNSNSYELVILRCSSIIDSRGIFLPFTALHRVILHTCSKVETSHAITGQQMRQEKIPSAKFWSFFMSVARSCSIINFPNRLSTATAMKKHCKLSLCSSSLSTASPSTSAAILAYSRRQSPTLVVRLTTLPGLPFLPQRLMQEFEFQFE